MKKKEQDVENSTEETTKKTLHNTTSSKAKDNVSDLVVWGNGDAFKLICKASSKKEGWMKSTKAMQIIGKGCIVQVTTQQGDNVAKAVTWVPNVSIRDIVQLNADGHEVIVGRELV